MHYILLPRESRINETRNFVKMSIGAKTNVKRAARPTDGGTVANQGSMFSATCLVACAE